jgi:Tfp pilus assembly protein PilN
MINLLPPAEKKELQAARTNVLLLRYNFALIGAVVFLGIATVVTYVYLNTTKASAQQAINESQAKVSAYASTASQAEQFRNNLTIAKQILDHEVTYSKVIVEISQTLPSGVIFSNLNLDAQTFGTETTFAARAKSYDRALALKEAFEKSPMFTNVHFQSITTGDSSDSAYPVTVTLNVTIKKDAAK